MDSIPTVSSKLETQEVTLLIQRLLMERAKRFLSLARWCQILVLVIGILTTILHQDPIGVILVASLLTLISVLSQWYSDYLKGQCQRILRIFEYWNGLGTPPTEREISDITLKQDLTEKQIAQLARDVQSYFSSTQPPSPRRLLENLVESSWWTHYVAARTAQFFLFFSCVIFASSVSVLVITVSTAPDRSLGEVVARSVVLVLMFLFSSGYFRLTIDYYLLSRDACQIEINACALLKAKRINKSDALILCHEYQVRRATAPMLPTFAWKRERLRLNTNWSVYRQKEFSKPE